MRSLAAIAVSLALLASAAPASASVALDLSIEQLTAKADVVVRGKVVGQESAWTRGGRIVTTVHLAVEAALKGQSSGTVALEHLGGHVGDIGQQISGEVAFQNGEEVVVFLRAPKQPGSKYRVVGMSQGKFHLTHQGASIIAKQSLDGLGLIRKPGGAIEEQPGQAISLEALRARISAAAAP